jgi:hypothetical protein
MLNVECNGAGSGCAGCGIVLITISVVALAITQLVFATMGLVHAVPNLKNPQTFNQTCIPNEIFEPLRIVWIF